MQSFRQYRKFRKQVQQQFGRHREHGEKSPIQEQDSANARSRPQSSSWLSSSSESSLPRSEKDHNREEVDLEKAESRQSSSSSDVDPDGFRGKFSAIDPGCEGEDQAPGPSDEARELRHDLKNGSPAPEDEYLTKITTQTTRRSAGTALGRSLTGIQARDRRTNEGGDGKIFVVGYEGEKDPLNPHNWSYRRRISATMLIASIGFVVGFASAIDASILQPAAAEFGVSEVVEALATGLYLIGFGVGALFAGPFSETIGRNPIYIITLTLYMVFVMASGLAPNIGAQLVFRFLAGFFGSTPLTCAGGSISDLWSPMERVFAFPVFANAAFTGPVLGPVIGGFIAQSTVVSWRWTEWTTLIMSGLVLGLVVLFQPETYPPILLKWKAKHMRDIIGDDRFVSEIEIRGDPLLQRLKVALYRPFLLTVREPIIILVALYLTVIYIVLFTFLDGYDYIFGEIHGTSPGITGLCFLGIVLGLFGASALVPLIYSWAKRDLRKIQEQGGTRLPPEFRLWFAMLGGAPAIPISLFWMGWTSYSWISIWSPLGASVLFGYGILCVFISSYQYIIDSYEMYAASALVSVTLIRYVVAGAMTVVGIPFYKNMGVHWTLTIMGCISALLVPVPYLFFVYGKQIRKHSKYAVAKE
ncbi:major facilitator superfamily domain-containing protein [Lophiotrema nucula]|uniref:Major facilitator superfamily domain-containing protein n=1 Tax=Lophiotrema nucula TaxID=690887 RepID=A0A6A5ZM09_9PLEO|nr:major facilitator superfamily domain-containing protein [Lophiotrema nucula]